MSLTIALLGRPRSVPWGTVASVAVHLAVGLMALWLTTVHPLVPAPPAASIAVELVPLPKAPPVTRLELSTPAPAPTTAPALPSTAATPPSIARPTPQPPRPGQMIHATPFFATAFLKNPANAKLKKTLSSFADSEKIVQLCNMEGIEQIRRANPKYDPDVLVSYAMSDFAVDGLTLSADGGAFHSGKSWTAIRLRCTVSADYAGVADFQFAIGKPIPKADWGKYSLPAQYEDSE